MTKASCLAYLLPYLTKLQQLALAAALRPKMSKAFPQVLDEELFEGRKMKQAEAATEWSCNATCINTLKRFRFKSSDIYGYLLGRSSDIDDISIAFAVAASAAYPVGFAPNTTHRYDLHVYALDTTLELQQGFSIEDLYRAMGEHILDSFTLSGKYTC